jgi:hypothetical protein
MNDDYLWDRSGQPDPEIERLERTLEPYRYRLRPFRPSRSPRAFVRWIAIAAALVAGVVAVRLSQRPRELSAWQVDRASGLARVGRKDAAASMRVGQGDILRTGAGGQMELLADSIGRVELGPESELRASSGKGLSLARGALHAFIWAPPREFVVETPSSRTVDLGCEYTLTVDPVGDGVVRVSLGWVAFQYHDRESFIPAGARCFTRKSSGPGIPIYEDAPPALATSLTRFEHGDQSALDAILANTRPRDGLTLWHLLTRVQPAARAAVFARFAAMTPLPADVTSARIQQLDPHALDLCWDALKLENTDWWRGWERRWN